MGPIPRRHALTLALGAIGVVLVGVIVSELAWGPASGAGDSPRGASAALAEAKLLPPIASVPPEQAYPETGTRPLFVPGRRPAPAGTPAGSAAKGQYVLHGVTIVDGLAIAFLKDKNSGKTLRVEKGKEVNGVRVTNVEPEKVTLGEGDDAEVLALVVQKGAGVPPAAAPPSGPFASPPAPAAPIPGVPPVTAAPPAASPAPRPAVTPATAAATTQAPATSAEELLARARARRAQRFQEMNQPPAAQSQNVQK